MVLQTLKTTSYSSVLGVLLAGMRDEQSIDQAEMAERMGLSQASYSRLEGGKSSFSMDQMFQAAAALGVSEAYLAERLTRTVTMLRANGHEVVSQARANAKAAKRDDYKAVKIVAGAALAGLLLGLLSQ